MKTAVIIKGNPKFIEGNKDAERFYQDLKLFLMDLGYSVDFDAGEPHTVPLSADLWISHSRGSSRLKFAPHGTKTIALGTEGGINNPEDKTIFPGQVPEKAHYILTEDMKEKIKIEITTRSLF